MTDVNLSDYSAVIADMEAKRDALDAAIKSIRFAVASGALAGAFGGGTSAPDEMPSPMTGEAGDIPDGAFHGKSIPDAVRTYLSWVRKKQTTRQIGEALIRGGMVSNSDNFIVNVGSVLNRLRKTSGDIVRIQDSWGLAEWLPPGFRPHADVATGADKRKREGTAPTTRKRGRPRKQQQMKRPEQKTEQAEAKDASPASIPQRLMALFRADPGREYSCTEMAEQLGLFPGTVYARAGELARKGAIQKIRAGVYRLSKDSVRQMPMAG